jgi:hypothetical protein
LGRRRAGQRRRTVLRLRSHHTLASKGIVETTVTDTGRLAWTDRTGPPEINYAHHPDELLSEFDEDDP